jgi:hypothetical protein
MANVVKNHAVPLLAFIVAFLLCDMLNEVAVHSGKDTEANLCQANLASGERFINVLL